MPTTIESFSAELWCEIFEFFDAVALYRIFGNLNSRITSILSQCTPLYLNVVTIKDYDSALETILPDVEYSANIKSISFTQEFQFEDFFARCSCYTLQQLRCLSLFYLGDMACDCTMEFLDELAQLPSFESLHLRVGHMSYSDRHLRRLLQLIFTEQQAFLSLKTFVLKCSNPGERIAIPTTTMLKQTNLKSLILPSLYMENCLEILPSIPHIKSMKIDRICHKSHVVPFPVSPSIISHSCTHLDLNVEHYTNWTDIEYLLERFPNLLQLRITCDFLLSNAQQWEALLRKQCSRIRKFHINFIHTYIVNNTATYEDLQKSFSTYFWLDRNVEIVQDFENCRLIVRF
ncbi:unnamed protein product [Adineta ricciae]|uniref:F-box domain-containing protein n=3 Tax=Adineta ricciae TaxID=249248 RepID=A0A815RDP6_ADIRI|nr:unnamed protein product [Adineta ricciae]